MYNSWYLVVPDQLPENFISWAKTEGVKKLERGEIKNESDEWRIGQTRYYREQLKDIRISNVSFIYDEHFRNYFLHEYYKPVYDIEGWNVAATEPFQYTVYNENDHYDWHIDYNKEPDSDGMVRKVSCTLWLNDPEEYEGGEFELNVGGPGYTSEIKSFKGKQGSAIIFLSHMYHRVLPVTKGTRKSLVLWLLGEPWV
jgi:PKHD-type hydroxylase